MVDDERRLIIQLNNTSDGNGESGVTKVDVSALQANEAGQACGQVRIMQIWASTHLMAVELLWDATTNITALTIPQDRTIHWDFRHFGGLKNPETSGYTGDLLLTTIGAASGDRYTIVVDMVKEY